MISVLVSQSLKVEQQILMICEICISKLACLLKFVSPNRYLWHLGVVVGMIRVVTISGCLVDTFAAEIEQGEPRFLVSALTLVVNKRPFRG